MKEEAATDALLRQFLLGRVEDEERERIESLFITDSHMKDSVLAAEQKLIDDYLEDCLSPADREAFISFYGETVAQRRKLQIAKSIQEWAVNQPATTPIVHRPASSLWDRLRAGFALKPILVLPIAATAVVAIVIGIVWVRTEKNTQYLAVQQELAQLNTPASLRELPAQMVDLNLKPTVLRSVDPQPELPSRSNVHIVELRLLWMQSENYPSYEASVRGSNDDQSYTIQNVKIEDEGGKVIRIRLPARMMTRGNYQIELTGVGADGSKSSPEVYSFTVSE